MKAFFAIVMFIFSAVHSAVMLPKTLDHLQLKMGRFNWNNQ